MAKVIDTKVFFKKISIWLPQELAPAAIAVARQGRVIHNTTVFLLRSAFDSYTWDKATQKNVLKPADLRPAGSSEALKAFNDQILKLRAEREEKRKADSASADSSPIEVLGDSVVRLARTLLDSTLLERVMKNKRDGLHASGRPAFGELPFMLSRDFVKSVQLSFLCWLKSIAAWEKQGLARPQMPSFCSAGKLPVITISEVNGCFPRLSKRVLFADDGKTIQLSAAEIAAWDELSVVALLERALRGRWPIQTPGVDKVKVLKIRIENGRPKLHIIVETHVNPPQGSFYDELRLRHPDAWAQYWTGKRKSFDAWVTRLVASQRWVRGPKTDNAFIECPAEVNGGLRLSAKPLDEDWISSSFSACGVDLGVSNVATVGFSGGAKGAVLSGKQIGVRLSRLDLKIDRLISKLHGPELRLLRAKLAEANGERVFSEKDRLRLRELSTALYQTESLLRLRSERARVVKNFAHQTAARVAMLAAGQKAAVVVVGRNIGWKNGSDLGREQSRRFQRIPHGLIITLLREKLDALGIGLLETEESWTSVASFADGDSFDGRKSFSKKEAGRRDQQKTLTFGKESKNIKIADSFFLRCSAVKTNQQSLFTARRGEGRERHWLFRQGPWPLAAKPGAALRMRVQADLNGALNMIRKVCANFCYTPLVSLKHEVWVIGSGGGGFVPLALISRRA